MKLNFLKNNFNTIGDQIYSTLKTNIIELYLLPGESLNIKDVSESLKVSRSPVRDALLKLSKDGLIDTFPQRGTIVSKINLERVEEERFIRASLEEKALIICVDRLNSTVLLKLEKLLIKQERALLEKDIRKYLYYDDCFHEVFFELANKTLSWELISNISGHYRRIRLMTLWQKEVDIKILLDHKEIVLYLKKGEKEKLIKKIREHVSKLKKEGEELLDLYPEYFEEPRILSNSFLDSTNPFKLIE